MAQKLVVEATPAVARPGTYTATRSAALNALAFLEPLTALVTSLAEADDADGYVAQAEATRAAIAAQADEAQARLDTINARIAEAEARGREREEALVERLNAADARAKAVAAKSQADAEAAARAMEAEQSRLRAQGEEQARRLATEIDTKRNELRDLERQLSLARAAYEELQRVAGVGR